MKKLTIAATVTGLIILAHSSNAQPAAKPPVVPFAAHRASLEALLKSNDKDKITQAFAGYKDWFTTDKKQAENAFWYARPLMMPLTEHAQDTLDLIDLAMDYKVTSDPVNVGYLFTLKAESYMLLDKPTEAMAALREGLGTDGLPAGREAIDTLGLVLIPAKKQKEMLEMFDLVIGRCSHDSAIVEGCLKQNQRGQQEEARDGGGGVETAAEDGAERAHGVTITLGGGIVDGR